MTNIYFKHISPFIRYAQIFEPRQSDRFVSGEYISYDRRLYFCLDGRLTVCVDGKRYEMSTGSLLCWGAGQTYHYETYANTATKVLSINFDLTHGGEQYAMPIPPTQKNNFDKSKVSDNCNVCDAMWLSAPLFLVAMDNLRSELLETVYEYRTQLQFFRERCSGILKSVLSEMARSKETGCSDLARGGRITDILHYIGENPASDLSNEALGKRFGYHPNHLNKIVLSYTGITLHRYVLCARINVAVRLLEHTDKSISQVGSAVGFDDSSYFSKCFKRITGRTPHSYFLSMHN